MRRIWRLAFTIVLLPVAAVTARADGLPPSWDGLGLRALGSRVALVDGTAAPATLVLEQSWNGPVCTSSLSNTGSEALAVRQVVLFDLSHSLPAETGLYGEGFTMLSQTGGTLGQPINIGDYTDADHYKIPHPADATTVYGLLLLTPPGQDSLLMGFASCHRFVGSFNLRSGSVEVALDTEGLRIAPGETWPLESLVVLRGSDRSALLAALGSYMNTNHPRLRFEPLPTGWCSWYTYGPLVTKAQVMANLNAVGNLGLPLKYIQIDDGYQAAMGDWLETRKAYGSGVQEALSTIREAHGEPAIWVAPFIAEENSTVFREHPDWFIMDDAGKPLRSDKVSFGGWRLAPWYALDGTHPGAQQHLESVFRTMRQDWGCTYFKLDANFWGALHGGHFHDPNATRVEAYRRGMAAILRGVGDGFVLGCNHPLWPSLGLIHGSRSSGDISRSWNAFRHTARENFSRNWQNGLLWWNDPDCVLLTGQMPENEFQFHATAVYATGGMLLSGDNLTALHPDRLAMLRKLLPPTGVAAQFPDDQFAVGTITLPDGVRVCIFNWGETAATFTVPLAHAARIEDFWSGENLGEHTGEFVVRDLAPHSARLLILHAATPGR